MQRRQGRRGLAGGDDLQVVAAEARTQYLTAISQGEAGLAGAKADAVATACRAATAALISARYQHGWVIATARARGVEVTTDAERPKRAERAVIGCWDHAVAVGLRAASWEATKTRW